MSEYVIWSDTLGSHECSLTDFCGVDETFPLMAGRQLAATWPDDASFSMNPDEPNNTLLTDSLCNTNDVIVASSALSDFFKHHRIKCVEYLPVTIYDHKRRPTDERYEIMHPLDPLDCLDSTSANVTYSLILKDQISSLDKIVLKEQVIPKDRVFFRCRNYYPVVFVRRSFAEEISKKGFTGVEWTELADYS